MFRFFSFFPLQFFEKRGKVLSVKISVDVVTGHPLGYGFVEMQSEDDARRALRHSTDAVLKGYKLLVDFECERIMKGWKPRRLGTFCYCTVFFSSSFIKETYSNFISFLPISRRWFRRQKRVWSITIRLQGSTFQETNNFK